MADPTTRLGLSKAAGNEPRAVGPLNVNFDKIDTNIGAIVVAAGVTPPDSALFDGAIVKEQTTGRVWIADKNVGGTFTKRWVLNPWFFSGRTQNFGVNDTAAYNAGYGVADPNCVNATYANVVAGELVLPFDGIYNIRLSHYWVANAAGFRRLVPKIAGVSDADYYISDTTVNAATLGASTTVVVFLNRFFAAGTTISTFAYQTSGGTLTMLANHIAATLVIPR